ncbi:hypothetical protein [Nocardiopsis chromatogenes]
MKALRERLADVHGHDALDRLADEVVAGSDPYTAADSLLKALNGA